MTKLSKKIIILLSFILIINSNLFANRLALEIAKTSKLERTMDNVQAIYNFINLYTLSTGALPADIDELKDTYTGIQAEAYLRGENITFTISNNMLTFSNIIPSDASDILNTVYIHLTNTKLNANLNADNNVRMFLEAKTIKFLNLVDLLGDIGNVVITNTEPDSPAPNDLWYRPDSNGGFFIYYRHNASWNFLSNDLNLFIFKDTLDELNKIIAPKGTKAYINNSGIAHEYISNGSIWLKASY